MATRTPLGTAQTTSNVTALATNYSAAVAAGDLLVIGYILYGTGTTTIAASDGTNAYTNAVTLNNGFNTPGFRTGELRVLGAAAVPIGTTVTLTWVGACPAACWVSKATPMAGTTLDKVAGVGGNNTNAPDSGATATTTQPAEFAFGAVAAAISGGTLTPGGVWTVGQQVAIGSSAQLWELYKELAGTQTVDANGTLSGTANWTAVVATFVEPPPTPPFAGNVGSTEPAGSGLLVPSFSGSVAIVEPVGSGVLA